MCNQVNESVGFNLDNKEMYLMVLYLLNENSIDYSVINIDKLCDEMENLVFLYPPQILNKKIIPILEILKEKNKTISLLSNTGFIKGETMEKLLEMHQIKKYFDFQVYSDQHNLSKPNKKIFEIVFNEILKIRKPNISKKDVMHIGDNSTSDIKGAKNYGFSFFKVSDENSFDNLYSYAKSL